MSHGRPDGAPLSLLLLLANLVAAGPAAAQSTTLVLLRSEVRSSSCPYPQCPVGPAELTEIDVEGARIVSRRSVPFDRAEGQRMAATADGRYIVWLGNDAESYPLVNLSLYDRATGSVGVLLSQPQPTGGTFNRIPRIHAHPREVRVVASVYHPPAIDASATGVRTIDVGGDFQTFHGLSADGRIGLFSRAEAWTPLRVFVVEMASGTRLGEFLVSQGSQLAISADGGSVYGITAGVYPGPPGHPPIQGAIYTRFEAATGATMATRLVPGAAVPHTLMVDPRTGRLYASGGGGFLVFDPTTFDALGVVATPLPPLPEREPYAGESVRVELVFDPHHPRAFLLATRRMRPDRGEPGVTRIDIVDTNTCALLGGADLGMEVGPAHLAVVPRPPAPATLSAEVVGTRVTLRWTAGPGPGLATAYRVEAGSSSGLADLATMTTGTTPTLAVEDVPPGTYYVRVRASNWGGRSAASPEIVVTVP